MVSSYSSRMGALFCQEHRDFLSRMSLYILMLYLVLPLILGLVVPRFIISDVSSGDDLGVRIAYLIATGGAAFLMAFLPALLLTKPGILRRFYEFLLFPLVVVCTAAQLIMYAEFGTEINDRLLGLFEGNFPALWIHAREQYALDFVIVVTGGISVALAFFLRGCRRPLWTPGTSVGLGIFVVVGASAAFSVGLGHTLKGTESYHPAKMSGAPVFQMFLFTGEQALLERASGIEDVLKKTAPIQREDERSEITARLGEPPESFLLSEAVRPPWLKKRPSHVFMFVMESKDYAFVADEELSSLAPRLQEFAREGISVPHFYAASSATIDAIQTGLSGTSVQSRYPNARVLGRLKLDTLPRIVKRAGYSPLFYAASHREFGNKGDSCEALGFERFVGLPDIFPEKAGNEWGVHDGPFFEWARTELEEVEGPKFVSFLNVSYHPPYNAPPEELGDTSDLSPQVLDRFFGKTEAERRRYAGHVRYADREIGEMVDWLVARYPDALFCLFGDHCGAKLRGESDQRVPFILWNDAVIDSNQKVQNWFGSHMDIPATLAALLLPEGESVSTLGEPLWSDSPTRVSLAGDAVLLSTGFWNEDGSLKKAFDPAALPTLPQTLPPRVRLKASAIAGLSWGLINDEIDFIEFDRVEEMASRSAIEIQDAGSLTQNGEG